MGNKVLIRVEYIKQRCPSRKFFDKYLGPFKMAEIMGNKGIVYRLKLLAIYCIYNVFSVIYFKLFKRYKGETPLLFLKIDNNGEKY